MLKTISLILLLLITSGVSAEECTRDWIGICKEDKGVFYVTEVLLLLDAMQTHDIPRHPGHYESNRYLGPYPSNHRINNYFGGWAVTTYLENRYGNKFLRAGFNGGVIVVEFMAVSHNYSAGINFKF